MKDMQVVIITGIAGSGKSTALRALEDIGYFCVDNLPVVLLPKFLQIQAAADKKIRKVAIVMDLREESFLEKYEAVFKKMRRLGYPIEILFLDATDESLLHRFSETRRVHPLAVQGSLLEGIVAEREKLAPLKKMAGRQVDTTSLNVHQLKDAVQRLYTGTADNRHLLVHVMSFGYRYGLPPEADLVFDVRFLPNPYFVKELKDLNGNDLPVREYVLAAPESETFLGKIYDLLCFALPLYEREGKARLNIAMGCTGGKHRSVALVNALALHLAGEGTIVHTTHRDFKKN